MNTNIHPTVELVIKDLENTLFTTLGPQGKNVMISFGTDTIFTKDGATILDYMQYDHVLMQNIINVFKSASLQTLKTAGDGTTSTAVLAVAIYHFLMKSCADFTIPVVKQLQQDNVADFKKKLKEVKLSHLPYQEIIKTSSNNNAVVLKTITAALKEKGDNGVIRLEKTFFNNECLVQTINGFHMEMPWLGVTYVNDLKANAYKSNKPGYVLLVKGTVANFNSLLPYIQVAKTDDVDLYIVAREYRPGVLGNLEENFRMKSSSKFIPMLAAGIGEEGIKTLEDLSLYLDCDVVLPERLSEANFKLGLVKNVMMNNVETIIEKDDSVETEQVVLDKIVQLKASSKHRPPSIQAHIKTRIFQLTPKKIVIKVGGENPIQAKENYDIFDDCVRAIETAENSGVVKGGGAAYKLSNIPVYEYYKNILKVDNSENITVYDPLNVCVEAYSNAWSAAVTLFNTRAFISREYIVHE